MGADHSMRWTTLPALASSAPLPLFSSHHLLSIGWRSSRSTWPADSTAYNVIIVDAMYGQSSVIRITQPVDYDNLVIFRALSYPSYQSVCHSVTPH